MEEFLLGVDVGSSSVKVCAYRRNGELFRRSMRTLTIDHPARLHAEMDVETMWSEMVLAIREVTQDIADNVVSIGISSACPTIIFLDENDKPLRPAILYLDNRSNEIVREFSNKFGGDAHFVDSGNRPGCSTSWLSTVAWVRDHEPWIWEKVKTITLQGGFYTQRLTGNAVIDWTQASYSGGFKIRTPENGWDEALLEHWQIDKSLLAPTGWSCLPVGTLTKTAQKQLGLTAKVSVAYGCADTAASTFALGIRNHGQVFESSGTSGVITFCLDQPKFDDTFMNRCHVFPNRWLAHGAMSTLGGAFSWLLKIWPDIQSIDQLEQLAATAPVGSNRLVFLPYLAGERSPIWDPEASAMWIGLLVNTTRADMARAVFEGTAFGLKQIFERGKKFWNIDPKILLGVGGGARSKLWTDIKNDILGIPYLCAAQTDTAAIGAAIIGGIAAGVFGGVEDPDIQFLCPPDMVSTMHYERVLFSNFPHSEHYVHNFKVYDMLYSSTKKAMHMLAN